MVPANDQPTHPFIHPSIHTSKSPSMHQFGHYLTIHPRQSIHPYVHILKQASLRPPIHSTAIQPTYRLPTAPDKRVRSAAPAASHPERAPQFNERHRDRATKKHTSTHQVKRASCGTGERRGAALSQYSDTYNDALTHETMQKIIQCTTHARLCGAN